MPAPRPLERRSVSVAPHADSEALVRPVSMKAEVARPLIFPYPRLARQPLSQADTDVDPPASDEVKQPANSGSSSEALRRTQPRAIAEPEEIAAPNPPSGEHPASLTLDRRVISELTLSIDDYGDEDDGEGLEFPEDAAEPLFVHQRSIYAPTEFTVSLHHPHLGIPDEGLLARHMPVFFEEEQVERHGTGKPLLQPAISGAHFFGNLVALPYKMVVEPPRQTRIYDYPFAAGRTAPAYFRAYPLRIDAGVAEAAIIIGLIALIP